MTYRNPTVPPTPENVAHAKRFVLRKWKERARERGFSEPTNLAGACKFSSMFAERVFGGRMRGNWYHQFVELDDQILDLTDYDPEDDPHAGEGLLYGYVKSGFQHDPKFWRSPEHRKSMASCDLRVSQWVDEFVSEVEGKSSKLKTKLLR